MNSSDPLVGSKRRLARAKLHSRELKRRLNAFVLSNPYRHVVQPDPDGIHEIHKLKARRKVLPLSFVDIATDAIENLRSALDLAVYAIAEKVAITDSSVKLSKVYFPFCDVQEKFSSRITGCCPNFPTPICDLLGTFKPYEGGDDILWSIGEFAKKTKHHGLTAVAMNFTSGHMVGRGIQPSFPLKWDRSNNEVVLCRSRLNTKVQFKLHGTFRIGLGDVPVVAHKNLAGLVHRMTGIVEGIIAAIGAEAKRIGLFSSGPHSK